MSVNMYLLNNSNFKQKIDDGSIYSVTTHRVTLNMFKYKFEFTIELDHGHYMYSMKSKQKFDDDFLHHIAKYLKSAGLDNIDVSKAKTKDDETSDSSGKYCLLIVIKPVNERPDIDRIYPYIYADFS